MPDHSKPPAPGVRSSTFEIARMDCPSEESLIRTALGDLSGVRRLDFDLPRRRLMVRHEGAVGPILTRLAALDLGVTLVDASNDARRAEGGDDRTERAEARTLQTLLAINAAMFVVELGLGLAAESAGLVADSLDMFADAAVYGLALAAVGGRLAQQKRAALAAGWLQAFLAFGALAEGARRVAFGSEPAPGWMVGVGLLALAANVACLALSARQRDRGIHMQASYLFSANDVLANVGVIVAGVLVGWTGSAWPDLVIGSVIAALVLRGARRILRLAA